MGYLKYLILVLIITGIYGQDQTMDYPDTISIDNLENIFYPVEFAHAKHARMVDIGAGCGVCHHYAEDEDFTGCAECHLDDPEEATLEEPTLNGAYHRSCLACHKEWSNERTCEVCHEQKRFVFNRRKTLDHTDIFSVKHPHIGSPEILSFHTPEEKGSIVTFHHHEHIKLYRYACVDCHQSESCASCHDYQGPSQIVDKTLEAHHDPCQTCHDTESTEACSFCHQKEATLGFTHEITGWSLESYHGRTQCVDCHTTQGPIQAPPRECANCHLDFEVGSFNHIRTGFQLSEDHLEIDCYDCHFDDAYSDEPQCVECHDDEYSLPGDLPGFYSKGD